MFGNRLCSVLWFVFFNFWPSLLGGGGGITFWFLIRFWKEISASDAQRGGVQVVFGHQKQWSPPLGSSVPWALKCSLTGRSTLLHSGNFHPIYSMNFIPHYQTPLHMKPSWGFFGNGILLHSLTKTKMRNYVWKFSLNQSIFPKPTVLL